MSIEITWNREDIETIYKKHSVPRQWHNNRRAELLQKHYDKFQNVPLADIKRFLSIQRLNTRKYAFTESYKAAETDENQSAHNTATHIALTTNYTVQPLQSHRSLTGKLLASQNTSTKLQQENQYLDQQLLAAKQQISTLETVVRRHQNAASNLQQSIAVQQETHRKSTRALHAEYKETINQLKLEHCQILKELQAKQRLILLNQHEHRKKLSVQVDVNTVSLNSSTCAHQRMFIETVSIDSDTHQPPQSLKTCNLMSL